MVYVNSHSIWGSAQSMSCIHCICIQWKHFCWHDSISKVGISLMHSSNLARNPQYTSKPVVYWCTCEKGFNYKSPQQYTQINVKKGFLYYASIALFGSRVCTDTFCQPLDTLLTCVNLYKLGSGCGMTIAWDSVARMQQTMACNLQLLDRYSEMLLLFHSAVIVLYGQVSRVQLGVATASRSPLDFKEPDTRPKWKTGSAGRKVSYSFPLVHESEENRISIIYTALLCSRTRGRRTRFNQHLKTKPIARKQSRAQESEPMFE